MNLDGKRIWVDLEHQKTGIMLVSLLKRLERDGCEILYTAREFANTSKVLDEVGISYKLVGAHGGADLKDKLTTHVARLQELIPIVSDFSPDLALTFSSVELARIGFGLSIPTIGFNDEPRSWAVAKLTLPLYTRVLTPACIPKKEYYRLGATEENLVQYNGIDEVAWVEPFEPDKSVLAEMDVEKGEYVLLRTEMTHAQYLREMMDPGDTSIINFLPDVYRAFPNHKYFIIPRMNEQHELLKKKLVPLAPDKIIVTDYINKLTDFIFYSGLVASGGGTIVRESALFNIPSIEFFPGKTAWQEHFLMNNEFPLWHIRDENDVAAKMKEILEHGISSDRFTSDYKKKLANYDNPNEICYQEISKILSK